jgi:hypothetical protein
MLSVVFVVVMVMSFDPDAVSHISKFRFQSGLPPIRIIIIKTAIHDLREPESMAPKTPSHLLMLADTTLTSLYERERLIRLGSHPSLSDDTEIRHSLDTIKLGLGQLESELEDVERSGASSQELKTKEDMVIKLQSQVFPLSGG